MLSCSADGLIAMHARLANQRYRILFPLRCAVSCVVWEILGCVQRVAPARFPGRSQECVLWQAAVVDLVRIWDARLAKAVHVRGGWFLALLRPPPWLPEGEPGAKFVTAVDSWPGQVRVQPAPFIQTTIKDAQWLLNAPDTQAVFLLLSRILL